MRLLVVEDERKVAGFLRKGLEAEGYAVDVAGDGDSALSMARLADYDAIVLDRRLPRRNGLEVLRELRLEGRRTPVLLLTSLDSTEDKVEGLDAGADDYLAKPFRFDELLARLRALIRRGSDTAPQPVLTFGALTLDRISHRVEAAGETLDLTPREFRLLEHFLLAPGRAWKRVDLLEKVWDMHFDPESNVVDVHVANIRRKLTEATGAPWIVTVRGVGYALQAPEES
jgi:two-component system OmpR family response regulator